MPLVAREDALQKLYEVSLLQFSYWSHRDLHQVGGFAKILPFVLVIITDKHATVPTMLTKQVLVITDEELDAFILAGRRRGSS